jgi:hypothetical protein
MYAKKLMATMAVIVTVLCAPMVLGKRSNTAFTDHAYSGSVIFGTIYQELNLLVQNDKTAPDDSDDQKKTRTGSETKGVAPESEPVTNDKKKTPNVKSKPLKPFVPSEKIPGEQAVDFPADI